MLNSDTNISIKQYLDLLQLCDSAFPIGSFNHSYGMETYLREASFNESKVINDTIPPPPCSQVAK